MKKDGEIKLLREERQKGVSQKPAAARTGMSERTARKYERAGQTLRDAAIGKHGRMR
jgi:transcriptional regulator with XRE-family HTH domain